MKRKQIAYDPYGTLILTDSAAFVIPDTSFSILWKAASASASLARIRAIFSLNFLGLAAIAFLCCDHWWWFYAENWYRWGSHVTYIGQLMRRPHSNPEMYHPNKTNEKGYSTKFSIRTQLTLILRSVIYLFLSGVSRCVGFVCTIRYCPATMDCSLATVFNMELIWCSNGWLIE